MYTCLCSCWLYYMGCNKCKTMQQMKFKHYNVENKQRSMHTIFVKFTWHKHALTTTTNSSRDHKSYQIKQEWWMCNEKMFSNTVMLVQTSNGSMKFIFLKNSYRLHVYNAFFVASNCKCHHDLNFSFSILFLGFWCTGTCLCCTFVSCKLKNGFGVDSGLILNYKITNCKSEHFDFLTWQFNVN